MPLTNAERQARFQEKRDERLKRAVSYADLRALRETLAFSHHPDAQRLAGEDVCDMLRLLEAHFREM